MNRERIEGAGDVSALMMQNSRSFGKARQLTFQSAFGLFWMPASGNAALNKYAMSDFYQLNFRAKYKFSGLLDGLQADFMYVFKGNMDKDLELNASNFHNKVDMHHLSLVIDYYF